MIVASLRTRAKEIQLIVLFALTGILAVFQFGPIPHSTLNSYACVYAAVCRYTSLWKLASGWKMRIMAKAVLVAVFVVFALVRLFYLFILQNEAGVRFV